MRFYAEAVFKRLWFLITGICWGIIFLLNWLGVFETAKGVLDNRGKIVALINAAIAWQWLPLSLFLLGVVVLIFDRLGLIRHNKGKSDGPKAEKPSGELPTQIFGVEVGPAYISDNVLSSGVPARYLHARVSIQSGTVVHGCKAYLTEIKGEKSWSGNEQLTFSPSEAPDSLSKAVHAGVPYLLDVLRITSDGEIHVCNHNREWPRFPRLRDLFAAPGWYELTLNLAGEDAKGEAFAIQFEWTGNWQTSFLHNADKPAQPTGIRRWEVNLRYALRPIEVRDELDAIIAKGDRILDTWSKADGSEGDNIGCALETHEWCSKATIFVKRHFDIQHVDEWDDYGKTVTDYDRRKITFNMAKAGKSPSDYPLAFMLANKIQILRYFRPEIR